MITGIWLYWLWVLLALVLDYIVLNCTYYCDPDTGNPTDTRCTYPVWLWALLIVYPFVPVLNVVGFVFLCIMLTMAEQRKEACLRGRFFEDVKRDSEDSADTSGQGAVAE